MIAQDVQSVKPVMKGNASMKHLKGKRFKCLGCNTRIPQKTVAGYYSAGFGLYNIPCFQCGQNLIFEEVADKEEDERIEYE